MKLATAIFAIVFAAATSSFLERIRADSSFCPPPPCLGRECEEMLSSCVYGTFRNFCGYLLCARGPNETCEEKEYRHRLPCGEGLSCRCNVCSGCSSDTLQCYNNLNCKNESMDHTSQDNSLGYGRARFQRPARLYRPARYPYALE